MDMKPASEVFEQKMFLAKKAQRGQGDLVVDTEQYLKVRKTIQTKPLQFQQDTEAMQCLWVVPLM